MTRVTMRLVGVFEASFRQIFCGFFNTEGFCRVFIPGLGGFLSLFIYQKRKISLGEFSGEFSFVSKTSVEVFSPCVFR